MEVSISGKQMEALDLDIRANVGNWISQDHIGWWQLENTQSQPMSLTDKYYLGAIGSEYVTKELFISILPLTSPWKLQEEDSTELFSMAWYLGSVPESLIFFLSLTWSRVIARFIPTPYILWKENIPFT